MRIFCPEFRVSAVGAVEASRDLESDPCITRQKVDGNIVRCPDAEAAPKMIKVIEECRDDHDSIGGIVTCVCR